jgi:tetratricopeptide (TPR) repeat protein
MNERALAMYDAMFGPDSRYAYLAVNNIGHDYWRKGDLARAKREFEKTLSLTRKFYPGHPDEGIALVNLSDVAYALKDCAAALESYRSSLTIFEAHMPEHPMIHKIRLRIGLCLGERGDFAEAERYFAPGFLGMKAQEVYSKETIERAARDIIALYSAWGRNDKVPFYTSFLADATAEAR